MPSNRIDVGLQRRAARARVWVQLVLCTWACACGSQRSEPPASSALIVLLPRDVQEIDPRFTGDAYGHKLSRLLFASLVTIDPDSLEVVPDLAERVDVETPVRYRVRLRSGLRFSDGSALDADDVAATFRSVVDPAMATRYARTYQRIARVQVEDPRTLVFELTGPHATFLTDLELPILRAEDEHRHIGGLDAASPIGAGPYVLVHRDAGSIELSANPRWHGGTPLQPSVHMLVVRDDNTRALRMLAGAGDLALNAIPPLLLPLFERDDRFSVQSAPGVGTTYLGLNLEAVALRDVRVRRALAHAIDRSTLIRTKLAGRARAAQGWIVPGHWAFAPDVPRYDHAPDKARALLREAGLTGPGQPPLRLTLRCGSDRFRQSVARAIAAMLSSVGIEVELRPSEVATLIADLNRGRFELTMLEVPEVVEPHVLTWFFGSDHVPGRGREGANRWRLRSSALDAALERGRAHVEREARIDAYREAQQILAAELPIIPLWHEDVVAVRGGKARRVRVARLGRFDTLAR
jgi:peptide/nickel transport system substrate-binding protein